MRCTEQATTAPEGSPRAAANNVIQLYYISTLHLGQATTISPLPALAPKLSLSRQPPSEAHVLFSFQLDTGGRERKKTKTKPSGLMSQLKLTYCSALL
jgi:hypothetical protein